LHPSEQYETNRQRLTTRTRSREHGHTVGQVAKLLGYGESKVRMLIISGDLRSLKDGGSRRVLPEWVDEYVARRASQAADDGWR
jgi:excisionase family DNA binding protein